MGAAELGHDLQRLTLVQPDVDLGHEGAVMAEDSAGGVEIESATERLRGGKRGSSGGAIRGFRGDPEGIARDWPS